MKGDRESQLHNRHKTSNASIQANYEKMEAEKTKLMIAQQQQVCRAAAAAALPSAYPATCPPYPV